MTENFQMQNNFITELQNFNFEFPSNFGFRYSNFQPK